MTSNTIRKILVAGACVAALGIVACKPKPAEETAASDAAAASDSTAMTAASDAAAPASDAAAPASDAAAPAAE